jgi:hypothetical protein
MAVELGPDGQPPRFDGAAWVSQDGRYFWNGAVWYPIKKRSWTPSLIFVAIGVFVVGAVGYFLFSALSPKPFAGDGVSNAKIDSSTEIEFDYLRSVTCTNLTFEYKFFDNYDKQVDDFSDTTGGQVEGGKTYHFDIKADSSQPINFSAVRFEADATCNV